MKFSLTPQELIEVMNTFEKIRKDLEPTIEDDYMMRDFVENIDIFIKELRVTKNLKFHIQNMKEKTQAEEYCKLFSIYNNRNYSSTDTANLTK